MDTKISIIGAGSAVFSLSLIRDLCLTPNLRGSTLSFMDVSQERLDAAAELCRRYAAEVGTELNIEATTNRRESLRGADFVVNAALVGGHQPLIDGLGIGKRHGYRFGGSYHIMHDEAFWVNYHQLALFESVIQDLLEVAPKAWYLQAANPVLAGITYLSRKYPEANIVGLCHGFRGVYHVADALGLDHERLTFEIPGVNHSVFLTHLYHDGQDVFPLLDRWIATEAKKHWETIRPSSGLGPKAVDLYQRLGAFPIGDTCTPGGGAWPWWYHSDPETEKRWIEDPTAWWDHHFARGEETVAKMRRVSQDPGVSVTEQFPTRASGEVIVPMIESIACDIPRVLIGNIPNSGDFVSGIPRDFEVEIPTLVSKRGIEGIQTKPLPPAILAHILRDRVAPVNLELAAYESGSLELLLQLVLMDPWSRSEQQARAFLQDILALPYHEDMRRHYQ